MHTNTHTHPRPPEVRKTDGMVRRETEYLHVESAYNENFKQYYKKKHHITSSVSSFGWQRIISRSLNTYTLFNAARV